MKTLYLDCSMGAAGDMLASALLELLPDPDGFVKKLNGLGIPGVTYTKETAVRCGIKGTHLTVTVNGEEESAFFESLHARHHGHDHDHGHGEHSHPHSGMHEIEHIAEDLPTSDAVKKEILAVYGLIAQAESAVHGEPVEQIHFHEVGAMDAVADIAAVCLLLAELAPERVIASPVNVGGGTVKCAHGILPVPAPATAELLRGVPAYSGSVKSELCTPTGAALLKRFVSSFGDMPVMRVGAVGYGMGTKDFSVANCLRAMLGDTEEVKHTPHGACVCGVTELCCNIDDMTAEDLSFAMERLFEAGAREVFTAPVTMKKSRAGQLLHVICDEGNKEAIIRAVFRYTSTIGVREYPVKRCVLDRETREIETPYGVVREKAVSGCGVSRAKYEYEDLSRIAAEQGLTLDEVRDLADRAKRT
ncbi:MAG: nickel pincer cofactor biosynthesis protein LarC [Clostridia bacterium]|nr:nickel pincer cofactor biosynthesis protein LarC [Clostridia bacterium]